MASLCILTFCLGKFSQMNCLFYNVSYCNGEKEPRDLLAETILKKKMKRCQRTGSEIEKLQFSTCYKGFCIQIVTSRTVNCVKRYCAKLTEGCEIIWNTP